MKSFSFIRFIVFKTGKELFEMTMELLSEKKLVCEEELIHEQEECQEVNFIPINNEDDADDDEYTHEGKRSRYDDPIPLAYKKKVLNIARAHPKWNLATLQKNGCGRLDRMRRLKTWQRDVEKGGTILDKYDVIDSWTYDRFLEARESYKQVTTRNLQEWASAAASQFPDLIFKASDRWIKRFKVNHRIRQRKITKFVSAREASSMAEITKMVDVFRLQTRSLIQEFPPDLVINTDQTGKFN